MSGLDTPALLVDLGVVERNIARVQRHLDEAERAIIDGGSKALTTRSHGHPTRSVTV